MYNNNNNLGKKKQYTRIHYYIQEYKWQETQNTRKDVKPKTVGLLYLNAILKRPCDKRTQVS
jgi:hypothetical protein